MTISIPDLPRGFKNWWSDSTQGLKVILQDIADAVNGLVLSGITADSFFSTHTQSSANNITLSTLAAVEYLTLSASGKTVTLPSASGEATVFDGGKYQIINAGSTYSFDVLDNGAATLASVAPGEVIQLVCLTDSTAAGTWQVNYLSANNSHNVLTALTFGGI
jgi:hypothetical protein